MTRTEYDGRLTVLAEAVGNEPLNAPNDGTRIGQILLPEQCANLCFGGRRNNRLFMTASQSLYSLYVEAEGA